jgi:hypothetical protein
MIDISTAMGMFTVLSWSIALLMIVVLLVAGFGLLRLLPWGRKASIVYSVYSLVFGVFVAAGNLIFMSQMFDQTRGSPNPEQAALLAEAYRHIVFNLVSMTYPILLLYVLYRPHVVAAFKSDPLPASGDDRPTRPPQAETGNPYQSP